MSTPRRAQARDANEKDIIAAFKTLGWRVVQHVAWDLDVFCPRPQRCCLQIEVKTLKPKGRLTASQRKLIEDGIPLRIVYSASDVVELVRRHMDTWHA